MTRAVTCVGAAFLALVQSVSAQDEGVAKVDLSGSVRGGYFSDSGTLDGRQDLLPASFWLRGAARLSDQFSAVMEGWVRDEDLSQAGGARSRLREGYVRWRSGPVDLKLGRQVIVWGRADRLNPTDNLAPRRHDLLVPDDDDNRTGVTAAQATVHLGESPYSLTAVYLPTFEPSTVPVKAPPGARLVEHVPDRSQWGVKFDASGAQVDWSVSYFKGLDLNPTLGFGQADLSGVTLSLDHGQVDVYGVDASTVVGRYGLRAEAAYTRWRPTPGREQLIQKSSAFVVVLGGDRTFDNDVNVNLQYIATRVSDYQDPHRWQDPLLKMIAVASAGANNQLDRYSHGMSVRVSRSWLGDTLETELAGVFSFKRSDYVIKPRITYLVNDHVRMSVGANVFRGDANGYFGRLSDNSGAFLEMRFSF